MLQSIFSAIFSDSTSATAQANQIDVILQAAMLFDLVYNVKSPKTRSTLLSWDLQSQLFRAPGLGMKLDGHLEPVGLLGGC
jgi:hypothetical protein